MGRAPPPCHLHSTPRQSSKAAGRHPPFAPTIPFARARSPALPILLPSSLQLDGEGRFSGDTHVVALCGFIRGVGEGDDSLNRLTTESGMLHKVFQA